MSKQTEALKLALEALGLWAGEDANHTEQYAAYHAIREALAEQPAQQEQKMTYQQAAQLINEMTAQQQEPVACAVCNEVHAILDADASRIIRNAADGYPEGRASRVLTLQERVDALCVYAADWRRWYLEKENAPPASKPLTDEQIDDATRDSAYELLDHIYEYGTAAEGVTRRIRAIARAIEAKLKEKNA